MTMTTDATLTQRIQRAQQARDQARDKEIRIRAETQSATKQLEVIQKQASEQFQVSSIEELQALIIKAQQEDLQLVENFEREVRQYASQVAEAEKTLGQMKGTD